MPASINYNGKVIASAVADQVVTLRCAGMRMLSNIVVIFSDAGTINYGGKEFSIGENQTVTMRCAGQRMTSNVIVRAFGEAYQVFSDRSGHPVVTDDDKLLLVKEDTIDV